MTSLALQIPSLVNTAAAVLAGPPREFASDLNLTADLQILLPLYNYPNHWDAPNYLWDDVAAANSQVSITAIINPDSGPGGGPPNADYVIGLNTLREANVTMLGYVSTNYSNRNINDVKVDIDLYDEQFNIDGIFLDETSTDVADLAYYSELYAYIQGKPNLDLVFLNAGVNIDEAFLSAADTIVIFEGTGAAWQNYQPDSYLADYTADRFAFLAYNVADAAAIDDYLDLAASRNVGYVYLTDDILDNPWDTLPTYWQDLLAAIEERNKANRPGSLYLPIVLKG